MKSIIILLTTFFLGSAHASMSYTSCNNGDIDVVGDGYMQVDIVEDGIEFAPYESSFSIDFLNVSINVGSKSTTYTVSNQLVEISAEGETFYSTVNMIMTLSADNKKLNIAYSSNFKPFRSLEMTCKDIVFSIKK